MSQEKLSPKDLQFSKTDRRVLLRSLEKYYLTQIKAWQFHCSFAPVTENKTVKANKDRRFRLRIKPIELVLHALGSDFMSNVTDSSIRKTLTIAAQQNGLIQSERQTLDYFHRLKRKRDSRVQVSSKAKR